MAENRLELWPRSGLPYGLPYGKSAKKKIEILGDCEQKDKTIANFHFLKKKKKQNRTTVNFIYE